MFDKLDFNVVTEINHAIYTTKLEVPNNITIVLYKRGQSGKAISIDTDNLNVHGYFQYLKRVIEVADIDSICVNHITKITNLKTDAVTAHIIIRRLTRAGSNILCSQELKENIAGELDIDFEAGLQTMPTKAFSKMGQSDNRSWLKYQLYNQNLFESVGILSLFEEIALIKTVNEVLEEPLARAS